MDLLNKVMIAGRLTRDPEVRETSNGKTVANLSLALDPPGGGRDGGGRDGGGSSRAETIYVDVDLWERTAENAAKFLQKGSPVLIEGRLRMERWEDKETGKPRRKLSVTGDRMKFLNLAPGRDDRPRGAGGEGRQDSRDRSDSSRHRESAQADW